MSTDAVVHPPQASPPDPVPERSRRRWLLAGVAAWAVLLLVVSYVSVRSGEPTVREQRDLAAAMPVVDRALGLVLAGAGTDTVIELTGPTIEPGCRITPMRDGADLVGTITLRTAEAEAPALLDRLAQGLPADYRARVRHSQDGATHSLRADAGEFVWLEGDVTEPGVIRLTAETGCRPQPSGFVVVGSMMGLPIDDEPARVFGALGVPVSGHVDRTGGISCPGGGTGYTATATGQGTPPASLAAALRPLAGAGAIVVTDQPDLYAYRTGPLSVVVEAHGTDFRVTTTTGCA